MSPAGELFFERRGPQDAIPLVCVHGGPGFTSFYLEPLYHLATELCIVCYDQAGCGRAKRSGARRGFSLGSFVDELEQLRVALGVDAMHLLGHSFGAAVIGEYALRYPARVQSAIFASASIDIPRWVADGERLVANLPLMHRMVLREGQRTGQIYSAEYQEALSYYYGKHVFGCAALPAILERSIAEADRETYTVTWGPNELIVSGLVSGYSLVPRLSEICCPTLFVTGRHDEATPEAHEFFAAQVQGARCVIFESSAHFPHITEQEAFLRVVRDFVLRA